MKRTKALSFLLAMLLVISSISCLTVMSSAANLLASGYTPETEGEEDLAKRVIAWEFYDDGTLYLYDEPGTLSWSQFADVLKRVELKAAPGALRCNLTQIPAAAFNGCYNLTEVDVSAGERLQSIGAYAFQGCTSLTDIALDQGIITIGDYAFYECTSLKNVKFSANLANVGKNIFKNCTSLETAIVPNGVLTIGYGMFENCVNLKNANLPDSLTTIGELAFDNCVSLEKITVPDSTTDVGRYAFYKCSAATSIYIGHNAENIGEYAFSGCSSLEDVEIACAMRTFPEGMFMGCTSITSIELEEGVVDIGKNAFKDCSALAEINIPSTVRTIGDSAFDGTALKEINIPADVELIDRGAFTNCNSLEAINVDDKNDFYFSVDGVIYDVKLNTLMLCPAGKKGEVAVWHTTTAIADDAFIGCKGITKVTIPNSVMQIGANAFNNCATNIIIKGNCDSEALKYAKYRGIATEVTHSANLEWKVSVEPDCINKGIEELVCSGCGDVSDSREIDELGHSYNDGVVTTKPTCETDGVVTFSCTREGCTESYTEVLPKTEHAWNDGVVIIEPTCTTTGTKRFTCTNTGCYDYYDVELPALNHSFDNGVVTIEETCTTDGEKVFSCTREGCSESYTEVIPAIGHNYVAVQIKDATCLENGKIQHTCSNCGDSYIEEVTGEHKIAVATVNATCTEPGKTGEWCVICRTWLGATTEIPAKGHSYANGVCSSCGATDGSQTPSNPGGTVVAPEGSTGGDQATKVPATPKLLLIKNTVDGINVTWKQVEGATGYRVYRRAAGAKTWTYLKTVTECSYLDEEAATGEYWRYTVRATSAAGFSGFENGIYIKRVDAPHLTGVTATTAGVKVTWTSVSNAKTYRVYRRGAGQSWVYVTTVTGTSYVDTAIKGSSGYYRYTVRAVDGYYSAYESGLLIKYVATPHLTGIANTTNGIKVTWNAVDGAKSYRVYRRGAGQSWVYVTTVTGTSYVDTAVKDSNGYYRYTVRAVDGAYSAYESGLVIKR